MRCFSVAVSYMKRSAMARSSGVISVPGPRRPTVRTRGACSRGLFGGGRPRAELPDRIPACVRATRAEFGLDGEQPVVFRGPFAAGRRTGLYLPCARGHSEVGY